MTLAEARGLQPGTDLNALATGFEHPSRRFSPVPLWWWSGERLEADRLLWQMDRLMEQGVWQAVVINLAPSGPMYGALADDPAFMSREWWSIYRQVCEKARKTGFGLWLYDQIGFSGANTQGRLVSDEPRFSGQEIRFSRRRSAREPGPLLPEAAEFLGAWFVPDGTAESVPIPRRDAVAGEYPGEGELVVGYAVARGYDYFSPTACERLIDATYGEYLRHVGEYLGTTIVGAFQDELPNVPTWGPQFGTEFAEIAGYQLADHLPALCGDPLAAGAEVDAFQVRHDYHRVRAELASRAFFRPLAEWLDRHGLDLGFDQQSPAREGDPIAASTQYADYLATHSAYQIPGSDHWGDPKLHSSLAHAHGRDRVWIEAFHSSGWGGTLEETYDWLGPAFRRGATLYDPHAVFYSTKGAWFEWAPPSTCWRQPYWPTYGRFATAVARIGSIMSAGTHVASTILYYPTESVQAQLAADGTDLGAARAEQTYQELNGHPAVFLERRGVLERAGVDYDILAASALADSVVAGAEIILEGERFANVVLPAVRFLSPEAAERLLQFAEAGGRLVCVAHPPERILGRDGTSDLNRRLEALKDNGQVIVVPDPAGVPAALAQSVPRVEATAPVLHRRIGDVHLVLAVAHDEQTGSLPVDSGTEHAEGPGWLRYLDGFTERGFRFRPPAGRPLSIQLHGAEPAGLRAQLWDPRDGSRLELPTEQLAGGTIGIETTFSSGTYALIVLGHDLPRPTRAADGELSERPVLSGPWTMQASSTIDNRWGDFARPSHPGTVPLQLWEFLHTDDQQQTSEVLATFGPFAEECGPDEDWAPVQWSLSHGLWKDPQHIGTLGPNGYVPEEFLCWRQVEPGGTYSARTHIEVPDDGGDYWLAVGANAPRQVAFAGRDLPQSEPGYQTFHRLPAGSRGQLQLTFTAQSSRDLRASFALTRNVANFRRPEWIEITGEPVRGSTVTFATEVLLETIPGDCRVMLSSDSPTSLSINGQRVGTQSDFDPYASRRYTRVHPYDLSSFLVRGENVVELRCLDVGRPVAVRLDSLAHAHGGLGLHSSTYWSAQRDGHPTVLANRYEQFEDPRYGCLEPYPHPLQRATWLEPATRSDSVVPLVPDLAPTRGRSERLSARLPAGTVELSVPSSVQFDVVEPEVRRQGDRLVLDHPSALDQLLTLEFHPHDGRRGGALLDGPVEVVTGAAEAPLRPWHELGLAALSGSVTYSRRFQVDTAPGSRVFLDLGSVRGSVRVRLDGQVVGEEFAGPWRFDLTDVVESGATHLLEVTVLGTLAPYFDVASPTRWVAAGQRVHGLFGPVALEIRT